MMKLARWTLLLGLMISLSAGCSTDIREISDVALVMITGIDYDKEQNKYTFTAYSILPSTTSMENSSKQNEWVASAQGISIMDAARNLRSRAGKTLDWQHDKFFIIGEEAATHALYEIIDYMTRSREIRISSYIIVSEGKAADKLAVRSETNDLIANDFLGRTTNEHLWGKSISLMVKDVSNLFSNPYRGFVTGRLSLDKPVNSSKEVLLLSGGSVFNKGKFVDWLKGKDTIAVYLLSKKREWSKLEFPVMVQFNSTNVTILMQFPKKTLQFRQTDEGMTLEIDVSLKAALMDMDHPLQLSRPGALEQLEKAASEEVEQMLAGSLNHFQKELKVDVLGFSDYIRQHHPREWSRMKDNWDELYPAIPVHIHVNVQFSRIGMSQVLEGT
ncbi:Ger(x)C family spore germination protein [Paenibacillus sp. GCM10023248]|uniref:Ger(x)C family spore germination protein n=1 Tax=unclassified Paenibacillus TaxID=185978 RepID=UPI0023795952|nr:Ger(x)C family spore germination protein [Paenibacillus sp. MAHUQ-63]MDD9268449.1 Ger(x)C family spore germination protein [Paenibacillus sp. MAHUQ-63]